MTNKGKRIACLSLSGGMDSSTLLLHLLAKKYEITALSFDYGQKHKIELVRAKSLVSYLKKHNHFITHKIIKLDGILSLLHSALLETGVEVPEGHYAQSNMTATVVPNRNKIFSSIIQAVALSIASKANSKVIIAMGIHAGDHTIYPDCRPEFIDLDYKTFLSGNWGANKVSYYLPYINLDKFRILQDGLRSCKILGLDFDEVYKRTMTSYKPSKEGHSDFKSGSSIERIEAFIKLGRPDPVVYGDKNEVVSWEKVKQHAVRVLEAAN